MNFINISIIILFFFIITIVIIIPSIWCINPSILSNLKYETISDLKIEDFEEPCLFICNHDQNPNDQIITCTEATKTKLKLNIISWYKEADMLSRNLKKLPLFPKYNLLYTKNNLVSKCREVLKKEHVWLFLQQNENKTGSYYIAKDKKIKIVLVKIKKNDNVKNFDNFMKIIFNRKFTIEYEILKNYNNYNPQEFINKVKNKLY